MHGIVIQRIVAFFTGCAASSLLGFVVGVIVTRRRARYWMEQLHLEHTKSIAKLVDLYELSKTVREGMAGKANVLQQHFPKESPARPPRTETPQ